MMGGGTTLHEALRLGANVVGIDLDPIPVLQARATLSDIPVAGAGRSIRQISTLLCAAIWQAYFKTTCPHCDKTAESWYTLYGARRSCSCGEVLIVDSLTHPPGSQTDRSFAFAANAGSCAWAMNRVTVHDRADVPLIERGDNHLPRMP